MAYGVKIIADSSTPTGARLTTFELSYPRFIHAEVMTHRVFSRNAASSRAIPVGKLIANAENDPAIPLFWGRNCPGMASSEELSWEEVEEAKTTWLVGRNMAVETAKKLNDLGLHKQFVNRVLEPYLFIKVLLSSTTYDNFFELRCSPAAEPHIQWLACEMRRQLAANRPSRVEIGQWHTPLVCTATENLSRFSDSEIRMISVGRCARVTHAKHDSESDPDKDLARALKMMDEGHWSPFEHVAQSVNDANFVSRNFRGWAQYRADLDW